MQYAKENKRRGIYMALGCGTIFIIILIIGFISAYLPVILGIAIPSGIIYAIYKWYITDKNHKEEQNLPEEVCETTETISDIQQKDVIQANDNEFILSAGRYVGGRDINVGIYDLLVVSGSGRVKTDKPNDFSEYLSYDDENSYNNIEISDGTVLKIDTGMRVKLYNYRDYIEEEKQNIPNKTYETVNNSSVIPQDNINKANNDDLVLPAGRYVGGRDIKPGVYNLLVVSGSGIVEADTQDKFYGRLSYDNNNTYNNVEIFDGTVLKISIGMRIKLYDYRECVTGEMVKAEEVSKPPVQFDNMDGHSFEYFCADVLRKNGYSDVKVTQGSGDQGVDILAERDNIKYAIQCKHYSQAVGNKAIQEIYTGMRFYHCHVGIVMTNYYFTQSAKDLAKENGIVLWDRDYLLKFLEKKEDSDIRETDVIKGVSSIDDDRAESKDFLIEIEEDYKGEVETYDKEKGLYPAGHYVVGRDIPKGSYYLTAKKDEIGSVELYEKYSDFKEDENSVIYENFNEDFFLSLNEDGGYLIVTSADMRKV